MRWRGAWGGCERSPHRAAISWKPLVVRLLVVNWQCRENPLAGGAEIHLHEIFGRLAARGHAVTLLCGGWPGCAPRATLDGLEAGLFDVILANPPYYANSWIAQMFIEKGGPLLKPGGRLFLVTKMVNHVAPLMANVFPESTWEERRGYHPEAIQAAEADGPTGGFPSRQGHHSARSVLPA